VAVGLFNRPTSLCQTVGLREGGTLAVPVGARPPPPGLKTRGRSRTGAEAGTSVAVAALCTFLPMAVDAAGVPSAAEAGQEALTGIIGAPASLPMRKLALANPSGPTPPEVVNAAWAWRLAVADHFAVSVVFAVCSPQNRYDSVDLSRGHSSCAKHHRRAPAEGQ